MRIEEVYGYQAPKVIMEAPYGGMQRFKDKAKAKVKGFAGGGQEEQGNIQAGEKANQLFKQFRGYIGKVLGPGQQTIDAKHLVQFLKSKQIQTDLQPNDIITPKEAQKHIMDAVRKSLEYTDTVADEQPLDPVVRNRTPDQQAAARGNRPRASAPAPKTAPTEKAVSPLVAQVNQLSDADVQELLSLLG